MNLIIRNTRKYFLLKYMITWLKLLQTGAVTCSGDTTVKLWNFELVNMENSKAKALSVLHTRTLKLEDPVLSVKCSPCGKLIAAALLDSTVKVFFLDTFKVCLIVITVMLLYCRQY